uniref:ABC transporter domain-containing protein n=1 Tax=Eucampia antarctica TaxID=49252 RepID=A0A7S2RRY1_9STRA
MFKEEDSSDNKKDMPIVPVKVALKAKGVDNIQPDWPSKGDIRLKDLKMRYRPENPLVIKGLTLNIQGGERVGVVGRTGSGKSSLLLTLLRIVEPSVDGDDGSSYGDAPIEIDGVDVLRIGLSDLRSKVGIIPQNPVLFSGTIRSNMDPFNEYTNDEIWNALERCGMKEAIEANTPGESLDGPVAEYGENLSQGQRQLLCLGRALLKKCRILLLDEATSSVDYETDSNIQRTLREDFLGCTVLTIAHRVNTIMDSDKILVMKDGLVAEFAPPHELLKDKTSIFSDIVNHSQSEQH